MEEVTGGSSSVLGGVDELQLSVEVESDHFNGFATSRLVVQDSSLGTMSEDPRSPSVELVSPSVETMSPPGSELAFALQSPGSSVGLVSLESSVCLASPSPSLEVVTPPQEQEVQQEELASSVSSSKTVVSEQMGEQRGGEGLDDRLAEAMVEHPVSASCSSRSSEVAEKRYFLLLLVSRAKAKFLTTCQILNVKFGISKNFKHQYCGV